MLCLFLCCHCKPHYFQLDMLCICLWCRVLQHNWIRVRCIVTPIYQFHSFYISICIRCIVTPLNQFHSSVLFVRLSRINPLYYFYSFIWTWCNYTPIIYSIISFIISDIFIISIIFSNIRIISTVFPFDDKWLDLWHIAVQLWLYVIWLMVDVFVMVVITIINVWWWCHDSIVFVLTHQGISAIVPVVDTNYTVCHLPFYLVWVYAAIIVSPFTVWAIIYLLMIDMIETHEL